MRTITVLAALILAGCVVDKPPKSAVHEFTEPPGRVLKSFITLKEIQIYYEDGVFSQECVYVHREEKIYRFKMNSCPTIIALDDNDMPIFYAED